MFSLTFVIPGKDVDSLLNSLEALNVNSVSVFENVERGFSDKTIDSDLSIFLNDLPTANYFCVESFHSDVNELNIARKAIELEFSGSILETIIKNIDEKDWIEAYLKELKDIQIGRFFIYNSDIKDITHSNNLIPIKINSSMAFGSGDHETTSSCIEAIEMLDDSQFKPNSILDMGCGTGILGICALKIWPNAKLLGIDIDEDAVGISNRNYISNGVIANAVTGGSIAQTKEFDLILCNILKAPLIDFAKSFYDSLSVGGCVVLSGFIMSQYEEILLKYESLGFSKLFEIIKKEWCCLALKK